MLPPASSIRVSYQQQHYRRDHIIIISAMFSLGLMNAGVVQAQSIISQIPTRPTLTTPEPPLPTPQPIEEPKLETPPSPVTPSPLENVPGTVNIKGFEFIGNTAFTQEKLRSAVNDLIDKEITFADLISVESRINNLYRNQGYINSAAVIEPQNISAQDGIVKVTIIEGGIENIVIKGTRRLKPDYIRSRLGLSTKAPLNQNRILQALQLLKTDPQIQDISAQISQGVRPDLSVLEVTVKEADTFHIDIFTNNGRSPSVGSWRRGMTITDNNLSGWGDSFILNYSNTDGSNALDVSYGLPVNPRNGTIKFSGGITKTNITEPPFDQLDITGNSSYYEIGFNQPLWQTPSQELGLGLAFSRQISKTKLGPDGFPLSIGANDNGETRISKIAFSQNWVTRNSKSVLGLYSQFNFGLGVLDATTNNNGIPDSHFFAWRGQGQYVRSLNRQNDMLLMVRSNLQLSKESLVPLEQFGIGGFSSVRGYRQDALLKDNGFLLSTELQFPIIRTVNQQGGLSLIPFVDFGTGWSSSNTKNINPGNTSKDGSLVATGLGLQWKSQQFKARIDWGHTLTDINSQDQKSSENRLYFSVESRL
ncbi:MAG: ShlB/FhaC/HecB family hemolysin secretion/activation protein [Dolichospermum sp.]